MHAAGTRRVAAVFFALALGGVLLAQAAVGGDAGDDLVRRAGEKIVTGDLDGAISDFTKALELDPKLGTAFRGRADAKTKKGDLDGAVADYSRAVELDPKDADAVERRGVAKHRKGDLEGALADYDRAIAIDPKHPRAFEHRGLVKRQKGDAPGAIADFTRATEIDPKNALAFHYRANTKHAQGDLEGALADYERTLAIDPTAASAIKNRGVLAWGYRDFPLAIRQFTRAIELRPADPYGKFYLFLTESMTGDAKAAATRLRSGRDAFRTDDTPWAHSIAGFLLGTTCGEDLQREADGTPPPNRDGRRSEAYFYRGMAAWIQGEREPARALLRECIAVGMKDYAEDIMARAVLAWKD